MKRLCTGISLTVFLVLFACISASAGEYFDDDTVIAVMKPSYSYGLLSEYDFGGVSVKNVKKIASLHDDSVSLLATDSTEDMLCITLSEGGEENVLKAAEILSGMDNVDFAQPNYTYHLDATANDPYYSSQYSLVTVNAPEVWDIGIDCSDTVVAVFDTGIKYTHADLINNLWRSAEGYCGWDYVNNDSIPEDNLGHGTHVAGIISASTNNGIGMASLAGNAKIASFKVFDTATGNTSEVCEALQDILDYEKKYGKTFSVINCSFGGYSYDSALYRLLKKHSNKVIVAAAGNDTLNIDNSANKIYPACYDLDNIICVGNSTRLDTIAADSNYGSSTVNIAAPGDRIISTYNSSNNAYMMMSGTSMATPLVSSTAAALLSKCPELSAKSAVNYILQGADKVSALTGYVYGGRRLNAYKSIALALSPVSVTFNSAGGTPVAAQSLTYGEAVAEPDEPTRTGYEFQGWLLDGEPYDFTSAVRENITLKAAWKKLTFTVTWMLDSNTVLEKEVYEYGDTPTHYEPERNEDEQYVYTFAGWSPTIRTVTGNAVYTALFTRKPRYYTVTWKDDDGSVLYTENLYYGSQPAIFSPAKIGDGGYDYILKEWSPSVVPVTDDASYTAVYEAVEKNIGEEIELLDGFNDKLKLTKTLTDSGDIALRITEGNAETRLVVYCAEYDNNNMLMNVKNISFSYGAIIPDMRGKNARIFIWTNENEPVTGVITDMDGFYNSKEI